MLGELVPILCHLQKSIPRINVLCKCLQTIKFNVYWSCAYVKEHFVNPLGLRLFPDGDFTVTLSGV